MITLNVSVGALYEEGLFVCNLITEELKRTELDVILPSDKAFDRSVYKRNQTLRMCASPKDDQQAVFRVVQQDTFECINDSAREDVTYVGKTAITQYDPDDIDLEIRKEDHVDSPFLHNERKRKSSVSRSFNELEDGNVYEQRITKFFKQSSVAAKMNWTSMDVRSTVLANNGTVVYFKVAFPEKGISHKCAAGEDHNGGCGVSKRIKVDFNKQAAMSSACWGSGNIRRICEPVNGTSIWFDITDDNGTVQLLPSI